MMPVTVGCDLIACSVMGKKRASQPGKPEPTSQKGCYLGAGGGTISASLGSFHKLENSSSL